MKKTKKVFYTTVYVGNLNYTRDEKGVAKLFSKFGKVQSVKLVLKPNSDLRSGVAFVEMVKEDEALLAIQGLNGRQIDGRTLKASIAKEREFFEVREFQDEETGQARVTTVRSEKPIAGRRVKREKEVAAKPAPFVPRKKPRKSGLEILFKHLGKI